MGILRARQRALLRLWLPANMHLALIHAAYLHMSACGSGSCKHRQLHNCCLYVCRQRRASTADNTEFATRCYVSSVSHYRCVLPGCFHTFCRTMQRHQRDVQPSGIFASEDAYTPGQFDWHHGATPTLRRHPGLLPPPVQWECCLVALPLSKLHKLSQAYSGSSAVVEVCLTRSLQCGIGAV